MRVLKTFTMDSELVALLDQEIEKGEQSNFVERSLLLHFAHRISNDYKEVQARIAEGKVPPEEIDVAVQVTNRFLDRLKAIRDRIQSETDEDRDKALRRLVLGHE